MEEMLAAEAAKRWPHLGTSPILAYSCYKEHIEENHEDPVERDCSFIYKVGVYAILDGNKMDYADVYVGVQRDPRDSPSEKFSLPRNRGESRGSLCTPT